MTRNQKRQILTPPRDYSGLSGGISLNDLVNALTDPEKRLEFPVKPWTIETGFDRQTKNTILGAAAILAAGAILTAVIVKNQ